MKACQIYRAFILLKRKDTDQEQKEDAEVRKE